MSLNKEIKPNAFKRELKIMFENKTRIELKEKIGTEEIGGKKGKGKDDDNTGLLNFFILT